MPAPRALIELARCVFRMGVQPQRTLDVLAALVSGCDSFRLTVNNLTEAAALVDAALADRPEEQL